MSPDATFCKGHGTGNDFVLWPDPDGVREVSAELAVALCHRRFGIGADGVLRVVRARHVPDAAGQDVEWFMDHRNADGTSAAMCGNGIRLFGRYLVEEGLCAAGEILVGTRSGPYRLLVPDSGDPTVHMGQVKTLGRSTTVVDGQLLEGTVVDAGTQHLVCLTEEPLAHLDLTQQPGLDGAVFPEGANIEFVQLVADRHVRMRVHERGAGETMSCGTGATAVSVVVAALSGVDSGEILVEVPGGRLQVGVDPDDVTLRGPVGIVSRGQVSTEWLATVQP